MSLTPREIEVLTIIVEDYIASAAPVGSRTVAKRSRLQLSPASMRNFMADLTEKGYLEQPHTSAGRIPTARAFRFYLDTVLRISPLAERDRQVIQSYLAGSGLEITDILRQASRLISTLSQQVGMVMTPRQGFVRWKHIEFVLLKPCLVMAVLVLQGGIIQNKVVELRDDLSGDELTRYANYLNHLFQGRTVLEVRALILRELEGASRELDDLCRRALMLADQSFGDEDREIFVDGTVNILDQPEFADVPTMRRLLAVLEERTHLLELLDKTLTKEGLRIILGQEADGANLNECSLVSSPYGGAKGSPLGVIGVIGPVRMDYAKVVPVVDFTARILTELIRKRF